VPFERPNQFARPDIDRKTSAKRHPRQRFIGIMVKGRHHVRKRARRRQKDTASSPGASGGEDGAILAGGTIISNFVEILRTNADILAINGDKRGSFLSRPSRRWTVNRASHLHEARFVSFMGPDRWRRPWRDWFLASDAAVYCGASQMKVASPFRIDHPADIDHTRGRLFYYAYKKENIACPGI